MAKKRTKRRRRKPAAELEATYICDSCGEEIVVPVDISGGSHQDYVEDCPVCCHPMTLHVDIDPDGEARIEESTNEPAPCWCRANSRRALWLTCPQIYDDQGCRPQAAASRLARRSSSTSSFRSPTTTTGSLYATARDHAGKGTHDRSQNIDP